jgi:hypothetical protein
LTVVEADQTLRTLVIGGARRGGIDAGASEVTDLASGAISAAGAGLGDAGAGGADRAACTVVVGDTLGTRADAATISQRQADLALKTDREALVIDARHLTAFFAGEQADLTQLAVGVKRAGGLLLGDVILAAAHEPCQHHYQHASDKTR